MATVNAGQLSLDVSIDNQAYNNIVNQLNKIQRISQSSEDKLTALERSGQIKRENERKSFAQKRENAEVTHQDKLRRTIESANQREILAQQKKNNTLLKQQNSWSKQMTASLGTIINSIKTFGVVYATAFIGNALKGALDFAGGLADIADKLNITVNEVYTLQRAATEAGVPFEKLNAIFGKLSKLNDAQKQAFADIGINADSAKGIELFNALLADTSLTQQILEGEAVLTVNAFSKMGKSIDELGAKFPPVVKDLNGLARSADEIGSAFEGLQFQLKEQFAVAIVSLAPQIKDFVKTLSEGLKKVNFQAVANGFLAILTAIGKFGTFGGFQFITLFQSLINGWTIFVQNLGKYVPIVDKATGAITGYTLEFTKLERLMSPVIASLGQLKLAFKGDADIIEFLNINLNMLKSQFRSYVPLVDKVKAGFGLIENFASRSAVALGKFSRVVGKALSFTGLLAPLRSFFGFIGRKAPIISFIFALYDMFKAMANGKNIVQALLYAIGKFFTSVTDFIGLIGSFIPGWKEFWSTPGRYLDEWVTGKSKVDELAKSIENLRLVTNPNISNEELKAILTQIKFIGLLDDALADIAKRRGSAIPGLENPETTAVTILADKSKFDATASAIYKELQARGKRIADLKKENEVIKDYKKLNNLGADALTFLNERYKDNIEEINNLLGVKEKEKKVVAEVSQLYKDVSRRELDENILKLQEQQQGIQAVIDYIERQKKVFADNAGVVAFLNEQLSEAYALQRRLAGLPEPIAFTPGELNLGQNLLSERRSQISNLKEELRGLVEQQINFDTGSAGPGFLSQREYDAAVARIKAIKKELKEILGKGAGSAKIKEKIDEVVAYADIVRSNIDGIISITTTLTQNELEGIQQLIQLEAERWQERSSQLEAQGLQTSALYKAEARAFEISQKSKRDKERRLQAKAWEQDKAGKLLQTIMNTAEGIAKSFTLLPPFNFINAGIVSAIGAAQLGIIASTKNPYKLARGGAIPGIGNFDTTPVQATPGEFLVNRQSARQNAEALEFINRGGRIDSIGGGDIIINVNGSIVNHDEFVKEVIPAIKKAQRRGIE